MTGQKISNQSDISNLFNSIDRIEQGETIDNVIYRYPKIKRNFLFLVIQEYYRNYENFNHILLNYTHNKTPNKISRLLKISLTLIFFSKKPHHAIVNDAVEASKKLKNEKFVNAVLRNILREKEKITFNKFIYPEFKNILNRVFTSKSIKDYIYETIFEKPINYQVSLTNQNGTVYKKRVFLLDREIKENCIVQDIANYEVIDSTRHFFKDKNVLDICAAPGGKSILLHSHGFKLECIDKSQNQINKFKENLERLGLQINIKKKDFLKEKLSIKYNSILLDAPCSALGTFRRNPDVIVKVGSSRIMKYQKNQMLILEKSLKLLNKKGILVYIVCSFHPFETIDVIDKVIQKHNNIKIHKIKTDKMIKIQDGYFINPLKFKNFGGSDIFFVSVLEKM